MKIQFYLFRRAYREASEALRAGDFESSSRPAATGRGCRSSQASRLRWPS